MSNAGKATFLGISGVYATIKILITKTEQKTERYIESKEQFDRKFGQGMTRDEKSDS